jgi:hypothetical protein
MNSISSINNQFLFQNNSLIKNNNGILNALAKIGQNGRYDSTQDKLLKAIFNMSQKGGLKKLLDESQSVVNASFIDSNVDPKINGFPDFLGNKDSWATTGGLMDDTFNAQITNEYNSQAIFGQRRFLGNLLEILKQGVPGISALLVQKFNLDSKQADQIALTLFNGINENSPEAVASINQQASRIQSREDGFAQNVTILKSIKSRNDEILKTASQLGGGNQG